MKKIITACAFVLSSATLSFSAPAAELGNWERFAVNVGGFVSDRDTTIRLDSSGGLLGTELDFEDDLGLDEDQDVARIDGFWRYGKRSRIDFSFYELDRSSTGFATFNFRFGDQVFTVGTPLRTELDFQIIKAAYTYSFVRNTKVDVGITAGLHVMDFNASITALNTGDFDEGDSTAPLPVIGARVAYQIMPKLIFSASTEWFGIEVDDYEGRFLDTKITIEHNTFKNVGFGVGFNSSNFDIESEDSDAEGEFEIDYDGWLIYAKAYF